MATNPGTALDTKEITSVLNGLIETCVDGEKGYRAAAEKAKEASLKALFLKFGAQRAAFAHELKAAVIGHGAEPATSGHVSASIHRGWMSVKEAVTSDSDTALINECEAGEDAAVKNYREALQKSLPVSVTALIQQQFAGILEAHNTMRDLKHSRN